VDEIGALNKVIKDLTFENSTVRRDLQDCLKILKDHETKAEGHKSLQ
jgi:hypothetical protein